MFCWKVDPAALSVPFAHEGSAAPEGRPVALEEPAAESLTDDPEFAALLSVPHAATASTLQVASAATTAVRGVLTKIAFL
jgi:hypothetical protein